MDREHWALFQALQTLIRSTEVLTASVAFQQIVANWNAHRAHEEGLMSNVSYPYLRGHREQHEHVQAAIVKVQLLLSNPNVHLQSVVHQTKEALLVLLDHVDFADRQYAAFIDRFAS